MFGILGSIILGGIAGWLAGKIMSGKGYGIIVDVLLGLAGGLIGGWILGAVLGIAGKTDFELGTIGQFFVALVGACVLVGLLHLIKREPIRQA